MITQEEQKANQMRIEEILINKCGHRKGIDNLIKYMRETDFYIAPASTRYHGAYPHALLEHSLDVYDWAVKLAPVFGINASEDSIAICALCHDLCKVDFYKASTRNKKVDGVWVSVPCYEYEEQFVFGGHGSKSALITARLLEGELTDEEATAINCHMGFSDCGPNGVASIGNAFQSCPLAWLIHVADEAATYITRRYEGEEN